MEKVLSTVLAADGPATESVAFLRQAPKQGIRQAGTCFYSWRSPVLAFLAFLLFTSLRVLATPVPVLDLEGSVDPGSSDYLVQGIEGAAASGAPAVIIRVDTPGGLVSSAREIVQAELGSPIPVIVYVGPAGARAGSAGVFVTLAGHVAAMAPGTTIGAAHPVDLLGSFGGAKKEGEGPSPDAEVMAAKILNDTTAWVRAIATQRGRNVEWAEKAVRESDALTDGEALANGVVDLLAVDLPDLLSLIDGREILLQSGPVVLSTADWVPTPVPMSFRQEIVHFLGDPNILFVLLAIGLIGLWVEYHKPGLIFPAAIGVTALLSVGVGLSILPFNLGGLLLVVFAFVLFALEIWIPSYGVLTISGALALIFGGLLLFDVENFDLRVNVSTLLPVAIIVVVLTLLVALLVFRSHRRKIATGIEALVDALGEVSQGGAGGGWIRVQGEIWKARWNGTLADGTPVRVIRVERLLLVVAPADSPKEPSGG